MDSYVESLIGEIKSLDAAVKYLYLLTDQDLDSLALQIELLLNKITAEQTRRQLNRLRS